MSFIIEPHESAEEILSNWNAYLSPCTKSADVFNRAIRAVPYIIGLIKENTLEHTTVVDLFDSVTVRLKKALKISSLWNSAYARICYELSIKAPVLDLVLSKICPLYNTVYDKDVSIKYRLDDNHSSVWKQFTLNIFSSEIDQSKEEYSIKHYLRPLLPRNLNALVLDLRPYPTFFSFGFFSVISKETRLKAAYAPDLLVMIDDSALMELYLTRYLLLDWAQTYATDLERVDVLIHALDYIATLSDDTISYMSKHHAPVLTPLDVYNCIDDKKLLGQLGLCVELGINDYAQIKELIAASALKDDATQLPVFDMTS